MKNKGYLTLTAFYFYFYFLELFGVSAVVFLYASTANEQWTTDAGYAGYMDGTGLMCI
jgi:hypothetical protein